MTERDRRRALVEALILGQGKMATRDQIAEVARRIDKGDLQSAASFIGMLPHGQTEVLVKQIHDWTFGD